MSVKELKALLRTVKECNRCGFCANASPTTSEMRDIITELIRFKEEKEHAGRSIRAADEGGR